MDLEKVLDQLREELQNLEMAITSLERLQQTGQRRRGRPPAWLGDVATRGGRPKRKRSKPKESGDSDAG
jgi:hypothetical protein